MIDLLHLPKPTTGNADYFIGKSTSLGQSWETWEKPRGITMIRFICIGGGGSGGNGFASATTNARGGGGGGGSGGYSSGVLPAILIPDRVYISAGRGGIVGAGIGSYVSVIPYTTSLIGIYTLCYANGGSGGGNGTATAVGALGAAAVIATRANTLLSGYGELNLYVGSAGSAGGAVAGGNATVITYPTTGLLLSGGCGGGGGASGTGGTSGGPAITTPGSLLFPSISAGTNGSPGGVGGTGIELYQPLLSTGGGGGGASNSATTAGGAGGNAGFGSGGGGGGAGGTGGGGAGGNGGNGLVIINYW